MNGIPLLPFQAPHDDWNVLASSVFHTTSHRFQLWSAETLSGNMVQMNQRFTNRAWVQHRVKQFAFAWADLTWDSPRARLGSRRFPGSFICICDKDLLSDALRFLPLMPATSARIARCRRRDLKASPWRLPTWCDGEPVAILTVVAPVHTPKDVRRIAGAG